jgi:hypothetical protein
VLIRISNALKLPLDYFFSNNNEVKLGKISGHLQNPVFEKSQFYAVG